MNEFFVNAGGKIFAVIEETHFMETQTAPQLMSTQQVARRLAELCKKGDFESAQKELFSKNVISIEPHAGGGFEKETKGLDAIIEKGHKFSSMMEASHGINVSEPIVSANAIAFKLTMDVTMKGRQREKMEEICVYTVKDGKIETEQFFM